MSDELKVVRGKINQLETDGQNANKGTERGLRVLDDSLAQTGLGRSIVTDKHGRIIAGNKTTERAIDQGFEDAIIVHTDGSQLVVVQRDDLDLHDDSPENPARKMAYFDNRAGELDLSWDAEQILADSNAGFDFSALFAPYELNTILSEMRDEFDYRAAWEGMPEFEQPGDEPYRSIIVHFRSAQDVERFALLVEQAITEKTRWLYFPGKERANLKPYQVVDES